MLQVNNLWYSYDGVHQVLKDISFGLEKGNHLSVMGESGCGKSTLLKAVYGLFDIERGTLFWKQDQILGPAYHLIPGMKFFKYVSQELELMPYTTVFDNVAQYLSRIEMKQSEKRVFELLETVDMTENARQLVKYLSGGQKQRVAIARALAREPELLLLDEPFSQIDNLHKNNLRRDLFAYLKDKNISCIVATHDSNDALSYADHLIVLKDGELVEQGDPKELYENPSDLYVASFFDDVNKIIIEGEEVYCYPHQLKLDASGMIKGLVTNNYFKGAYWLVELKVADQKIYFQHHEALSSRQEASLRIKKI